MKDLVVQTAGLTKRYGKRNVVNGLDLRVEREQIYGFLGLNGAGKTTTIRMLMGLIRPTSGSARLFGHPIPAERMKVMRRVGALVESPSYYAHLSGRDNLRVVATLLDVSAKRVSEVLEIVRLTADAGRKAGDYSLGMKQRLGIATALLGSPELVVLDEPTNGLDPAGIHEIRDLIRSMPREHGISVLVSSHLLAEIDQMATTVGVIHGGRLLFQGPIEDLRARSHGHVRIEVDRPEAAIAIAEGFPLTRDDSDGGLLLDSTLPGDAARLVRTLVGGGVAVYRVEERQRTLEEIFLELTGEGAAA
ncbi:MAG: ABC transporter ATP-binding protein [Actinomycetota bacterium]|nr:MAG: bacitracin ABC transporter ATP-binding [Actinomycetota bacterium]MDO8950349.1 ABC transporter ATP-binding protein [Actinomycetota bacterium]MDP3629415.1 ABC transporter ATP-binding protein [Actinomycetota bacterium]